MYKSINNTCAVHIAWIETLNTVMYERVMSMRHFLQLDLIFFYKLVMQICISNIK